LLFVIVKKIETGLSCVVNRNSQRKMYKASLEGWAQGPRLFSSIT